MVLRSSDFVICIKSFYNQSGEIYTSALEHRWKVKFGTYTVPSADNNKLFGFNLADDTAIVVIGQVTK